MSTRDKLDDPVARARLAVEVLAVAREAVGGLWLRARAAPAREALLNLLDANLPEAARIGPETEEFALAGGIDVSASLATGKRVLASGLLCRQGRLTLTNAERASPALSSRLAQALDQGARVLVAIDEGMDAEEALAPALAARTGLFVSLDGFDLRTTRSIAMPLNRVHEAKEAWLSVSFRAELDTVLAEQGEALGILDSRHLLHTRSAARAIAALEGRHCADIEDLLMAMSLVLLPRATQTDQTQPEVEELTIERDSQPHAEEDAGKGEEDPAERLAEADHVVLPPALLDLAASAPARGARGAGAGKVRRGTTRGRPLPSRPGHAGSRARIDPVATLRAAVPWQRLRPPSPRGQPVSLRPPDIRIRRFEERSDRVVIFTVDASGSQAMARMAEAKGAVECLLNEAYRRRDEVALVAFRDRSAEVLLAPTRALLRARNALAGLPAGGATPLAAGLGAARSMAGQSLLAGATPLIVLLTDGRANIARDGRPDRRQARLDAEAAASDIAAANIDCLVLDTSRRPEPTLAKLAARLDARYTAIPQAGAREMSTAILAALDG